jgi:hypothetical protein
LHVALCVKTPYQASVRRVDGIQPVVVVADV